MTNLRISEEQFNEIYPDMVGYYSFFNDKPPAGIADEDFENRYLKNKLWRLNNCYYVVNKDGDPVLFRMNLAQHKVYGASREHPRVIILKSRQQGISTFWLVSYFDDAVFSPLKNIGMMAQGVDEASTLLERSKFLWDTLDSSVKEFAGVRLEKDNSKEFKLSNDSTIFIRVSFRSTTLQRLHVSEMGKIANNYPKRAKEVKTGTLQALGRGNTGIIESTAEGMNMFSEMWDEAIAVAASMKLSEKDFKPVFLSWVDDPDCLESVPQVIDEEASKYFIELEATLKVKLTDEQKWFWVVQRRELGADIHQEYPGTPEEAFKASKDGTYWNRAFKENILANNRVYEHLYDPNYPVEVFMDIGVEDYCVCVLKQFIGGRYKIVGELWDQNYDLAHYIDELAALNMNITRLFLPHDGAVREFAGGNIGAGGLARKRSDIARAKIRASGLNWTVNTLTKLDLATGLANVNRAIPLMDFDKSCVYLMKCMQRYSREYDEKLGAWKRSGERHDEWSHGAAAIRYMCSAVVSEHKGSNKNVNKTKSRARTQQGADL